MKPHVWLLPLVMGCALAAVYILPQAGSTEESAVKMELPDFLNGWEFQKLAASADEIQTLSGDTEFSKATCFQPRPGELNQYGNPKNERVDLSVVLSGHDLNNSIHRPERCMPAQGHRITGSENVMLPMENGHSFKAKRLRSVQSLKDPSGKVVAELSCLTYYFFVGHDEITNDHLERTIIDMKDRLVRGMDQRWAYVSASMWFGDLPWNEESVSEEEADEKLRKFVAEFSANQIDWEQIQP